MKITSTLKLEKREYKKAKEFVLKGFTIELKRKEF